MLIDYVAYAARHNIAYSATEQHHIHLHELQDAAREQNVEFRAGDILIVRTGLIKWYNETKEEVRNAYFTDPNKETDGERSSLKNPHPFQTDKAVRNAYALGCDKKTIVDTLYGRAGSIGDNLLYNPPLSAGQRTRCSGKRIDEAGAAHGCGGRCGWRGVERCVGA